MTPIPGGTGSFTSLGSASIDHGRVVFVGSGAGGQTGIYEYYNGQLTMRVNQSTPIPGGTGGFTKFDIPSLDGADIAFQAEGASKQGGVYMQYDGKLAKIADTNTQIPGTTSNFSFITSLSSLDVGDVTINNRTVQFRTANGVFLGSPAALEAIAATIPPGSTPIPDQPYSFNSFAFDFSPDYANGQVLFAGRYVDFLGDFSTDGLYRWTNQLGVQKVLDQNTILPGQSAPVGHFLVSPTIDDGMSYFSLLSAEGLSIQQLTLGKASWEGLFRADGGNLQRVISREDLGAALDATQFVFFFAFDDGRLVFPGANNAWWNYKDGHVSPIIASGDFVDGRTVDLHFRIGTGRNLLSGNQVALTLEFTDGSSGIYIATIPEPSTLAMGATALAALAFLLRRRSRGHLGRGVA
ncbi:MAG: hypothetical protein K2Y37_11025 [Pirellulales bacterium]|nr:hypothetical protein [Pirellulales bacterium]